MTSSTFSGAFHSSPQGATLIDSEKPTSVQSISYGFLWIYTFLLISRGSEFIDRKDDIHMAFITAALAGAGALMTAGFFRAFNNRIGIALAFFTSWLVLEAPFSTWRGGTFQQLTEGWLKSYSTFLIVAALIFTMKQVRGMFLAVSLATVFAVCISLAQGVENNLDSRLSTSEGTFANANDLASALLMGLPFLLQCAGDPKRNKLFRVIAAVAVPPLLVVILRTGSRGALVAIAILITFYFLRTSVAKRFVILLVLASLAVSAPFFVSKDVFDRYKTIFLNSNTEHMVNEVQASAIESEATRQKLLQQAGELILKHPLFGVGLGQFAPQAADLSLAHGETPVWRTAHSFLVLVATETGLPGLLFYCCALVFSWKALTRIVRQARQQQSTEILGLARTLFYALLCFIICATFSTNAFTFHVPFLAAMVVSFTRLAKLHLDQELSLPPAPSSAGPEGPLALPLPQRNRWGVAGH